MERGIFNNFHVIFAKLHKKCCQFLKSTKPVSAIIKTPTLYVNTSKLPKLNKTQTQSRSRRASLNKNVLDQVGNTDTFNFFDWYLTSVYVIVVENKLLFFPR